MSVYMKEFEEEWQTHKNRFMDYLITLSEPIPVYFQGEERDELLNKLRQMAEKTCELDIMHDEMIRSTKKTESKKKRATTGDSSEIESFKKLYEEFINEAAAANRQNPKKHQMYSRLEKTIIDSVDRVSEKDDIVMTDAQINITDPITMTVLEDPVRNRLCNHVYSKKSIQSLLKKAKQLKCPVVGCPIRLFTMEDLESDHELEEHINKIKAAGGKK